GADAEEVGAEGSNDDHRPIRQRVQRAGGVRGARADRVPRREMTTYGADLSFSVYAPTRVVFGAGGVDELPVECRRLGIERAVVVTDGVLRERTDVVARVERVLASRLVGVYDRVSPDTGVEVIDEGAAFARAHRADGLVSVG